MKEWLKTYQNEFYIGIVLLLVAIASFGLGRLSIVEEKQAPVSIYMATTTVANSQTAVSQVVVPTIPVNTAHTYVAARTGKVYYIPLCSAASRIKEENKVWFATKADAEKAGYKPASNCPGL